MFPDTLQADICLHIHGKLFKENPAFRAAVLSCKRSLATKLRVQHFLPRQHVIKQGDEVDKVFFIVKGIVHVIVDGKMLLALGKEVKELCVWWDKRMLFIKRSLISDFRECSKVHFTDLQE